MALSSREKIRLLMVHEFRLCRTTTEAHANINRSIGEGAVTKQNVRTWFRRFKTGNFRLEEKGPEGRRRPI